MIEPIRISFEVACPPDRAFRTWTAQTSIWWPSSHTMTAADGLEVVFEPLVPLLGMIWKSIPDLGPSFQQFASGLKRRAEGG